MNSITTKTGGDWRCPYCGELVLNGNSHMCHNQYQSTYEVRNYDPGVKAHLERIADALEKITLQLQQIGVANE